VLSQLQRFLKSFYLQGSGKKSTGMDIEQNYVSVTLCREFDDVSDVEVILMKARLVGERNVWRRSTVCEERRDVLPKHAYISISISV